MKLDGVDADPVDLAVFAGILRISSRAGDLSVAVPDRQTLATSSGERAKRYRSEILRAALTEVFEDKRYPMVTAVRHYGDQAAICVSYDRFRALSFTLVGSRTLCLTTTFAPPQPPPIRRAKWERAIRELRDRGWQVQGAQLVHGPTEVLVEEEPIHRSVARAAEELVRDLVANTTLLRRYQAVTQPGPARANDLAFLAH
jgi:hypothetical protein